MLRALLLPVGRDLFAISVDGVREVVEAPRPTPLPTAPPAVRGLINVRGEIVPLFDIAVLAGVGVSETPTFAAVVDSARGLAALAVDGLPEIVELGDVVGPADVVGGIATHAVGDRLVVLVDVEALVGPGAAH